MNTPFAASIGYFFGLILAYFLMTKKLFKNGWFAKKKKIEFVLFFLSGLIGIFCTYTTVFLYTKILSENIHLAKISAIFISFFSVYLIRRYLIFKEFK